MAELRADLCKLTLPDLERVVAAHPSLLITCRIANSSEEFAREQIITAIRKGARYVDVEIEAPVDFLEYIKAYAHENGAKLIISYHNFELTPSLDELRQIADLCRRKGADIVKMVTTAHTIQDAVRVLKLYDDQGWAKVRRSNNYSQQKDVMLLAFSMGEAGRFSRYLCLHLGAPYTYVSYGCGEEKKENPAAEDGALFSGAATAPGQYTLRQMEQLLSRGNFEAPRSLEIDSASIPCSKSVAQRAILGAAFACGETVLENFEPCNDIIGAIEVVKELGCTVEIRENREDRENKENKVDGEDGNDGENREDGLKKNTLSGSRTLVIRSRGAEGLKKAAQTGHAGKAGETGTADQVNAESSIITVDEGVEDKAGDISTADQVSGGNDISTANEGGADKAGDISTADQVNAENGLIAVGEGVEDKAGETNANVTLNVGESGLLTRLLIPFAAYLSGGEKGIGENQAVQITISGHGSILKRDLKSAAEALKSAGVDCSTNGGYLPFRVCGGIKNKEITFSGKESSQIVSGFLMTLPLLNHNTVLTIESPTSIPYIELTLNVLKQFGIQIEKEERRGFSVNHAPVTEAVIYKIKGGQVYLPSRVFLDSDWSSAAYFAVAFAIASEILESTNQNTPTKTFHLNNMPLHSHQADEAILDVLRMCGVTTTCTETENGRYNIQIASGGTLKAFDFDATHCPDLFPILAVLACHCTGTSRIKGVNRLLQKESNRAETVFTEFSVLGAHLDIEDDFMYIRGKQPGGEAVLHGGNVHSHNDHRIAMSLIVAALFIREPVWLDDVKCINKSFPSFLNILCTR